MFHLVCRVRKLVYREREKENMHASHRHTEVGPRTFLL